MSSCVILLTASDSSLHTPPQVLQNVRKSVQTLAHYPTGFTNQCKDLHTPPQDLHILRKSVQKLAKQLMFLEASLTKPTLNKLLSPCCVSAYNVHANQSVAAWASNISHTPESTRLGSQT